jgi:hypothetical protein
MLNSPSVISCVLRINGSIPAYAHTFSGWKFDGYLEDWTKATFLVESIKELIRLTDEFEEGLGEGRRVE